jgi:phage host-nuclease inhibitor protein Gam
MIEKIVLSNFMAHAQTELKLAEGLTVLVGPNNIGKSTVAVALKILARNTNSNFVMQHEQKECSISVQTSEGHSIQWIKRKSPSYVINGQAKDRLGRGGTPPELDETLRLAPVEFEDKDFEPHFGDQKSPIFLINRPPSQIAQFFSTTSDAEKLVAMQRLHQKHRSESQTQAKLLAQKNESIQHTIQALECLPKLASEFESLEREALSIDSLASEIDKLERLIAAWAELTLEKQFERHRANCLEKLMPAPAIHATEHLVGNLAEWETTEENHRYFCEAARRLAPLVVVPKLADENPLATMAANLTKATLKFEYYDAQLRVQTDLVAPERFVATDDLESHVQRICQLERDHNRLDSHVSLLKALCPAPSNPDASPLREAVTALEKTMEQFANNQSLLEQIHNSIMAFENDSQQWLQSEPTCNTCGAKLSVESIRFKMHGHGS